MRLLLYFLFFPGVLFSQTSKNFLTLQNDTSDGIIMVFPNLGWVYNAFIFVPPGQRNVLDLLPLGAPDVQSCLLDSNYNYLGDSTIIETHFPEVSQSVVYDGSVRTGYEWSLASYSNLDDDLSVEDSRHVSIFLTTFSAGAVIAAWLFIYRKSKEALNVTSAD